MKRSGRAKLTIRRETLRKLAAGELAQAAGGMNAKFCTYRLSGCQTEFRTAECESEFCGRTLCSV